MAASWDVMVLANGKDASRDTVVHDFLESRADGIEQVNCLGGEGAITSEFVEAMRSAIL